MAPSYGHHRPSLGVWSLTFLSCLACLYVAGRLWSTTRELHYVRTELNAARGKNRFSTIFPATNTPSGQAARDNVLFYSIRPKSGPGVALKGNDVNSGLPIQRQDEKLLGQIDGVEAGVVTGWACSRGQLVKPLEVQIFVDNMKMGEVQAGEETPHHIVHRLCEVDMHITGDMEQPPLQRGVGFKLKLPELPEGRHEVRAFVKNLAATSKQELNQSPLAFIESRVEPGMEEALKRKDGIIRVRNAQIAALWDDLHTRLPWRNALEADNLIKLPEDGEKNESRALVVFGVNTGIGARERRDNLRRSWVPTGQKMRDLEKRGIYIRFVVGYSEQKDDPDDIRLQEEMKAFNDIVRLDIVDSYSDLSGKTLKMFSILPAKIDADFYFKVDDDVAINIDAMEGYLKARRKQGNLYMGCMKSGQVLTDRRYKWYEPEYWRFGDAAGDGGINYMRHASGQIYGLSGQVAKYIGRNMAILHRYANEDVSVGAWLVGLDVAHVDERRFCCDSPEKCENQSDEGNLCLSYYEHQCAGICSSEQRLETIWASCLDRPLERTSRRIPEIPKDQTKDYINHDVDVEDE